MNEPQKFITHERILIWIERALILALILLVMASINGIRYTSPDDISGYVAASEGFFRAALENAISSGRIWMISSAPVIYLFSNPIYSAWLVFVSNVIATFLLYELFRDLYGSKIAAIWVISFLSIVPIGWWFNVLVAYPGFYFGIGLSCLAFLLLSRYLVDKNTKYLVLSLCAYTISLNNYEIVTIFSILILSAYTFENYKNNKLIISIYLLITAAYIVAYLTWSKIFGSYEGGKMIPISADKFFNMNIKYILSGLALYNPTGFFGDYSLIFKSKIDNTADIFKFNLTLQSLYEFYIHDVFQFIKVVLFTFISSIIVFRFSFDKSNHGKYILILPILLYVGINAPFIFSAKYQDWFLNAHVPAYTNAVFVSISLALIFALLSQRFLSFKAVKIIFIATAFVLFLLSNYYRSKNIDNILQDNVRWDAVDAIFKSSDMKNKMTSVDQIYAPALWSVSWMNEFQYKSDQYWKIYTTKTHSQINFVNAPIDISYYVFDFLKINILLFYRLNKADHSIEEFSIAYPERYSISVNGDKLDNTNCLKSICESTLNQKMNANLDLIINGEKDQIRVK